jgi:hypothetical protein
MSFFAFGEFLYDADSLSPFFAFDEFLYDADSLCPFSPLVNFFMMRTL